jgi:cellulose synthase/poly-beta-1,6-N-acetylglucosamine synthase-like glycosyltransferase
MTDIEIPLNKDRHFTYRLFEILPGALSWFCLLLPVILSLINVTLAAFFILGYILIWTTRGFALSARTIQGYRLMRKHQKMDWFGMLHDLSVGRVVSNDRKPDWHAANVAAFAKKKNKLDPEDILQAVFIATYKESREILKPTIDAVLDSNYDPKKIILVLAYEERGGERTALQAKELMSEYKNKFYHTMACEHPSDIPNELIGKGGNITFAGRKLQEYLEEESIDPARVVVTTLDADNRPDKNYLASLAYLYSVYPDPQRVSFQPMAVYNNNIWDAPAPMRVLAVGNSCFHIANSTRLHLLRNFSAHSQSMKALIDMDFWSVRTVVEDGHHFWRSYLHFNGNYRAIPVFLPIYQDAVLSDTYLKTLKAQFLQYRRWTWGASDVAYLTVKGFFTKNKLPRWDLFTKSLRLLENHVGWAVGSLLVAIGGRIPILFNSQNLAAHELPIILGRVQQIALVCMVVQVFICFVTLPPKPERYYKKHRTILMLLQWVYMPVTGIVFNSVVALYSQTRLMLGRYMEKFDVTEKAVVASDNTKRL